MKSYVHTLEFRNAETGELTGQENIFGQYSGDWIFTNQDKLREVFNGENGSAKLCEFRFVKRDEAYEFVTRGELIETQTRTLAQLAHN